MTQARDLQQEELATKVAHWAEAQHLGAPINEWVMESTLRYWFRWSLLICGGGGMVVSILLDLALRLTTHLWAALTVTGWLVVGVALGWLISFLRPFRRYDKKHTTHFYLCPNGMVQVLGGSIVSTYYWAQVQATSLKKYKGGYTQYTLHLVDGRQVIFKGMYQPPMEGLRSAITTALESYRLPQQR